MRNHSIRFLLILCFLTIACDPEGSPKTQYGEVKDFGIPCATGSQCESKRCIEIGDSMACTRYCNTAQDCPDSFYCALESLEDPEKPLGLCRPIDPIVVCKRCSNDLQCEKIGGTCHPFGNSQYCLMDCTFGVCPFGYTCTNFGDGTSFCTPDTGECECNTLKEGTRRSCSQENEFGVCSGAMNCLGQAGWTVCDARIPGPEVCDDIDNNCDGNIDEGILGTVNHCGTCYHACQGGGFPGTTPVCVNNECALSCADTYFDVNANPQDGCECMDDTFGATSVTDAISQGSFTSCDFAHQIIDSRVPADAQHQAHPDYIKFNYENVWNCVQELEVHLRVPSSGATHVFCVSRGNDTNEANWTCKTVAPGTAVSHAPYNQNGAYYIKVALANPEEANCSNYLLTICDGNRCP